VYADDETSLEQHVVNLLEARGATLALAEVGSGGSLAAGLSGAERADRVLAGAYVAPTEQKLRRLLGIADDRWAGAASSAERTRLVAQQAADATGSAWSVAVGEARPDATGTPCAEVVFKLPGERIETQQVRLRGGEIAHARLVTDLLDQLRRRLR